METKEILERQKELLKKIDILSEEKKLIKMLGPQTIFNDYKEELFAIINLPGNKEQRAIGGILSTVIDSFDYGVIIGKRLEKAKHKKVQKLKAERINELIDDEEKLMLKIDHKDTVSSNMYKSILARNLAECNNAINLIK